MIVALSLVASFSSRARRRTRTAISRFRADDGAAPAIRGLMVLLTYRHGLRAAEIVDLRCFRGNADIPSSRSFPE
jgi:hypothetical protein